MTASVPCPAANTTAQKCTENQVPLVQLPTWLVFFHCLYTRIRVNESVNQTILGSKDNKKSLYAALTVSRDTLTTGLKLTLMYAPPLKFTRYFENLTAKKSKYLVLSYEI